MQQQAAVRADVEAGGPLTSRLSAKTSTGRGSAQSLPFARTSIPSAVSRASATASDELGGALSTQPPPLAEEAEEREGEAEERQDEAGEGIPIMFLRRPSIRQFRTVWVEPRAAGEHGIKEQVGRLTI